MSCRENRGNLMTMLLSRSKALQMSLPIEQVPKDFALEKKCMREDLRVPVPAGVDKSRIMLNQVRRTCPRKKKKKCRYEGHAWTFDHWELTKSSQLLAPRLLQVTRLSLSLTWSRKKCRPPLSIPITRLPLHMANVHGLGPLRTVYILCTYIHCRNQTTVNLLQFHRRSEVVTRLSPLTCIFQCQQRKPLASLTLHTLNSCRHLPTSIKGVLYTQIGQQELNLNRS